MIRKRFLWMIGIPMFFALLVVGGREWVRHNYERARIKWKNSALPHLVTLSATNEVISKELQTLKAGPVRDGRREWVGDNVLLMTNGEYLIYASRHGANSGFINHLFLARGSDGKWLYSTYHFCNSMVSILAEDAPGSIAEFAERYAARKFDGKSDECLRKTWPVK